MYHLLDRILTSIQLQEMFLKKFVTWTLISEGKKVNLKLHVSKL